MQIRSRDLNQLKKLVLESCVLKLFYLLLNVKAV